MEFVCEGATRTEKNPFVGMGLWSIRFDGWKPGGQMPHAVWRPARTEGRLVNPYTNCLVKSLLAVSLLVDFFADCDWKREQTFE